MENKTEEYEDILVYPVIVMRTGGLDGVALQAREYRHLLNHMDIGVHVITGHCETKFSTENPVGHQQTVLARLDFNNKISKALFANEFESGSETELSDIKLTELEWETMFLEHKTKIKERIYKILKATKDTPVLIYNLLSLRHAQPAAAVALKEIMVENPNRAFLSHSADPDAERTEKIERIKKFVLPYISANEVTEEYSGGPLDLHNLYHIVLNPTQHHNFLHKYNVDIDHIFEIPDFLDFPSKTSIVQANPKKIFIQYMRDRQLRTSTKSYKYKSGNINKDTIVFLSPVRPVYRKLLKEAMLMAKAYSIRKGLDVAFIVTHPNIDDKQYFLETVKFAEAIDLSYYHLGESFTVETLDTVYENLAAMNTIGVVASNAGGWENALNEMARASIPFYMNNTLNSFKPLTEEIGIRTLGIDFDKLAPLVEQVENNKKHNGVDSVCENSKLIEIFSWFDDMLDKDKRTKLISYNYIKAYNYLSHQATLPRLVKCINYIYEQHCKAADRVNSQTLSRICREIIKK